MSDPDAPGRVLPAAERARIDVPLIALLSLGTGATDYFAFTQLRGIFTANITGDLVFVGGGFARPDYTQTVVGAVLAIVTFAIGATTAFLGLRRERLGAVLAFAIATQVLVVVTAVVFAPAADPTDRLVLTALSAVVMSFQAAVTLSLAPPGVSTNAVTGTLTSLLQSLVDGDRRFRLARLSAFVGIPVGAALAGVSALASDAVAPAITLLTLSAAAVVVAATERRARRVGVR